jgi:hypothetical protein
MKTEESGIPSIGIPSIGIDYSIRALRTKHFAYNEDAIASQTLSHAPLLNEHLQHLQVQGNVRHLLTSLSVFSVILDFTLQEPIESSKPIVTMVVEVQYNVHLFRQQPDGSRKQLNESDAESEVLPTEFVRMLVAASYSATRGILWSKLGGTPLQAYLLPMIDPQTLIPTPDTQTTPKSQQSKQQRKAIKKASST